MAHTLGPTCAYYEHEDLTHPLPDGSDPPRVKAQFFYISNVPIDDPLSPLPPIISEKAASKQTPQPFSVRDNAALEEAWQGFHKHQKPRVEDLKRNNGSSFQELFTFPQFDAEAEPSTPRGRPSHERSRGSASENRTPFVNEESILRPYERLHDLPKQNSAPQSSKKVSVHFQDSKESQSNRQVDLPTAAQQDPKVMLSQDSQDPATSNDPIREVELGIADGNKKERRQRRLSPFHHRQPSQDLSPEHVAATSVEESANGTAQSRLTAAGADSTISGRPFARALSSRNVASTTGKSCEPSPDTASNSRSSQRQSSKPTEYMQDHKTFVPVGLSRLHLVEMPDLIMKPIYWSPINDKASVVRATWFYKQSMMPLPTNVANRLELGYAEMKPYSDSYQDELDACVDNGPVAELKIVHELWPEEKQLSRPGTAQSSTTSGQVDGARDLLGASRLAANDNAAADAFELRAEVLYHTWSVIFVNGQDAQLLKPSLLPSETRGRKPLNSIRKGRQIGVAVVRGFDRKAWSELYPSPKMDTKHAQAALGGFLSQSGDATTKQRRMSCTTCDRERKTSRVSDLVLVVHGIGQKLSERVDSYHFTHAINGLRRELNVELASEAINGNLRRDTGVMVLPVNWRLGLSFDENSKSVTPQNEYQLSDITPDSLPAIRSLVSDVMLDIPYYLSHHKDKMTSAVIKEANRVYRLWCLNNPGFGAEGRVHLVAHSLGSAMAIDILSRQPTKIPLDLDLTLSEPSNTLFEFNTTNLFCCGSPAGFFLLLNGASLVPRKGIKKPGTEVDDWSVRIAGDAGTYGCLAVDNIYNIFHRNDPVAYQLNACVDQAYAASLMPASMPSANMSFFARVGNAFRLTSSTTAAAYGTVAGPQRPQLQNMPSTVEMETHNFSREEVAEKRMYLLNDNGQIDYILNPAGGPLDFQYLDMLGAHSSYWVLQDFARFLVVEIGREPGRSGTLPVMRAQKKREYKKGTIV